MKKEKSFSPILAPNQGSSFKPTDNPNEYYVGDIKYPVHASFKVDGIRCLFKKGEILSRSLKQIQNKQLREKFEAIRAYSEESNTTLDGEIYNHNVPFGLISSCVMTKDYEDKKAIKAWEELQEKHDIYVTRQDVFDGLKFYCFDYITNNYFDQPYFDRYLNSVGLESYFDKEIFELIKVFPIYSMEELKSSFDKVIAADYEGLILRDPKGHYKFGRGSIKEGLIYKVKPFETWDAQIIGIVQATEVNPNAEKKINELGRSVTSKKLEDRILIEQAAGFIVKYEGKDLTVPLGGHTAVEKKAVWKNKDSYVGRWIEYKGMEIGMKDVPRIPKFVRYREDKDE